jgi:N-hydroxyarylamine O-acetyltransferase
MDSARYLQRINFTEPLTLSLQTLSRLHEAHVFSVPFENLNIHSRKTISLEPTDLFQKVINENRGGYCYELNSLFCYLLQSIGFSCRMVSSSVYATDETRGPAFDHLSLIVHCENKRWLLDVGFGNLFIRPLEIVAGMIQTDGRNFFKIEHDEEPDGYCVLMSDNGTSFEKKYAFNTRECSVDQFAEMNQYKQHHPDSYFVKNLICTLPTSSGRVTVFNNKLIVTTGSQKKEETIASGASLQALLKRCYKIDMTVDFFTSYQSDNERPVP